jgi:hypothetical protein
MAGALTAAVFGTPVVCSIAVAGLVQLLWGPAATTTGTIMRWVAILAVSTVVFLASERLTRRVLPLGVLLKMGMVFPGRAPKRFSVARRTWTTQDLNRRIDDARDRGISDEPTVAAEQIVALAATLSAHDRRTRGHAERVRAFTDLMAEELRLPDDDRDRLRWSALLHDVGKLTVHADILNKPGVLSEDEWELMRRHPLEGAKLTAPLAPWLGPWANTIAEHHERFDGRGYPFGLAGHDISTGGRIVAVADAYDTMTSVRSYKKPLSPDAARAELAACAGTHFDPAMVRAFLGVSVSRLRAVAPLSWIGSLPFGNLGPQLARLAATGGRVGITGMVATAGVVGLAAGQRAVAAPRSTHLSATRGGGNEGAPGAGAAAAPSSPGAGGAAGRPSPSGTGGQPPSRRRPGTTTTSANGTSGASRADQAGSGSNGGGTSGSGTGSDGSGTSDSGTGSNGGGTSGSGPSGAGTTTTVGSGSGPTVPTTIGQAPPGSTTTTTTAPPPPLIAPSGLSASSGCQALILLPEVTLTWTPSPTTRVTGYVILRSNAKTGSYTSVGNATPRTAVTYTDTTVGGLGTTYWYKVEAVAGGESATSGPVSATTPGLCL